MSGPFAEAGLIDVGRSLALGIIQFQADPTPVPAPAPVIAGVDLGQVRSVWQFLIGMGADFFRTDNFLGIIICIGLVGTLVFWIVQKSRGLAASKGGK